MPRTICLLVDPADLGRVPILIEGALLAVHRRTVSAALRAAGRDHTSDFARYHRVLNQARWSVRAAARVLLGFLLAAYVPSGSVVIGVDDTLERRWGRRIAARGIYRDLVRSDHGHFVKASGLPWVLLSLLAPISWAGRVWSLLNRAGSRALSNSAYRWRICEWPCSGRHKAD